MTPVFQLAGPNRVMEIFGVKLVGVTPENGKKLLISVVFILLACTGASPTTGWR